MSLQTIEVDPPEAVPPAAGPSATGLINNETSVVIESGESVEKVDHYNTEKTETPDRNSSCISALAIMPITTHNKHLPPPTTTVQPSLSAPKKRKNSFFSRLSSFRFSLKNSKKEQHPEKNHVQITPVAHHPLLHSSPQSTRVMSKAPIPSTGKRAPPNNNFVHIPLKDPVDQLDHFSKQKLAIQRQQQQTQMQMDVQPPPLKTGNRFVNNSNSRVGGIIPLDTSSLSSSSTSSPERVMLHKKPPLHPPRVIGVCAKRCADAKRGDDRDSNNNNNQQQTTTLQSSTSGGRVGGETEDSYRCFASHNPRSGTMQATGTGGTGASGSFSKIGLIETNLDTHETIISGKTRSLMELHPQHGGQRMRYSQQIPPHQRISGVQGGRQSLGTDGRSSVNTGPADAIRQRPHKSMEFLLDKENQLYTLVSGIAVGLEIGRMCMGAAYKL